jgi:hypothetical protein
VQRGGRAGRAGEVGHQRRRRGGPEGTGRGKDAITGGREREEEDDTPVVRASWTYKNTKKKSAASL